MTLPSLSKLTSQWHNTVTVDAPSNLFAPINPQNTNTGVYVIGISPSGDVKIALGRKVAPGRRVPFSYRGTRPVPKSVLQGAAGTNPKYWGKWASLGGGADSKATNVLQAAVIELNDEAAIPNRIDARKQVFIPGLPSSRYDFKVHRLVLIQAEQPNPTNGFHCVTFFMPNFDEFNTLFPDVDNRSNSRHGRHLVAASHGEIDATVSVTPNKLMQLQSNELRVNNNNIATVYTLNTLQTVAGPAVSSFIATGQWKHYVHPKMAANVNVQPPTFAFTWKPDVDPREPQGWRDLPPGQHY